MPIAECRVRRAIAVRRCAASGDIPQSAIRNPQFPRGISLLEVLVSMFVLLLGLLGVASMFPVGNHYAASGERYDRAASTAPAAFAELKARGYLRPENWVYAPVPNYAIGEMSFSDVNHQLYPVIQPQQALPNYRRFSFPFANAGDFHPGHAFVIDPLGASEAVDPNAEDSNAHYFPYTRFVADNGGPVSTGQSNDTNPWQALLPGENWPVRRVTLAQLSNGSYWPMTEGVAEMAFKMRDDLVDALPEENDRPGQALWKVYDPGTPNDPTDDEWLSRQFEGAFTWLATVVPNSGDGLRLMQPGDPEHGNELYDVSVAIFSRREPIVAGERAIAAEMQIGNELVVYATNSVDGMDAVNNALQDVRSGQFIAVAGVHPNTGQFLLKWYRTLSIEDEILDPADSIVNLGDNSVRTGRRIMLDGPEWPLLEGSGTYASELRAILLPGCVGVATRAMPLELDSSWTP